MAEARRKLIVVSNRGPVSFARDSDGERIARRGSGGLVTALRPLVARHDVTWIASAMGPEDRAVAFEHGGEALDESLRDGSSYRLRLVAHDEAAYDGFYNVVANPTLWFLQHYLWDLPLAPLFDDEARRAWTDGYVPVNAAFARAVLCELEREPEASVLFQDYHLYLAPRFVRDAAPEAALAHFVHIPWPDASYWTVLPPALRLAIHDGLLASDVVGFHAERWRRSFLRCCRDLAGAEVDEGVGTATAGGRRTRVTARPISVDSREFDELALSERVVAAEQAILADRPEKLLVRVDRTDPSKNIVRGFRAFDLYLEAHPEMHGRVVMLALLDPSRQEVREYAAYLEQIEQAATAVNERFGRDGWTPVDLRIEDDFPASVAAYKQFDALLVNAVFDGLNLVSKEAPLVNTRDGVVILSENAGAHEELGEWALSVNPFDVAAQAEAFHRAFELGADERRARIDAIRAHVRTNDVTAWSEAQLADLDAARGAVRSNPRS
ncbi:MAG: trehalose-6-phosphate synthase [Actinomycetota bacterium]|nr:trehalose-6-phosphate synthase [Actinomycetota bacterium]